MPGALWHSGPTDEEIYAGSGVVILSLAGAVTMPSFLSAEVGAQNAPASLKLPSLLCCT